MFNRVFIALVVFAMVDLAVSQQVDATQFCSDCHGRRNGKDLYANPDDCHSYYQCFFVNETYAVGFKRQCPPGLYWNNRYFTCVLEGPTPCSDICENDTVATLGCAPVPGKCSSYLFCASGPTPMCCPTGTVFNAETCQCDEDTNGTCTDTCIALVQPSTSLAPPVVNGSYCIDSFGNTLTNGSSDDVYVLVDPSTNSSTTLPCAPGSQFSLELCSCGSTATISPSQPSAGLCSVYLPLNGDALDYSNNHFTTFIYDNVTFVNDGPAGANQSAFFQGGTIEIPGTKSIDLQWTASWCAWFKSNTSNGGGVLSNNNNENSTDYTFILATTNSSSINVKVRTQYPFGSDGVSANVTSDWNQVCVVFNGTYHAIGYDVLVYVNNQVANNVTLNGWTEPAHCPYTVGNDQAAGYFYGNIAQVLICEHALSADEVNAHYQGQDSLAKAGLIPSA